MTETKSKRARPAGAPASAQRASGAAPGASGMVPSTIGVQTVAVTPDEAGMRVDRFLEARFPTLAFSHIQRIIRKGELTLKVDGREFHLEAGDSFRFESRRPHRFANPTDRPAVVLWVNAATA